MAANQVGIVVHPSSRKDILRDADEDRKKIMLSKIGAYETLKMPPDPDEDIFFRSAIPKNQNPRDMIDDNILYALYKNAVDLLITNDYGIKDKAKKLSLDERVFDLGEAVYFFQQQFAPFPGHVAPDSVRNIPLHNLDLADVFFDSLRASYPEFNDWFSKKARDGESAWVYRRENNSIGAFLMLKDENEALPMRHSFMPPQRRVKISTLKVDVHGFKIGELFIKIAIEYAIFKKVNEVYLTIFEASSYSRPLMSLLTDFGFESVGYNPRGEVVLVKRLRPATVAMGPLLEKDYSAFYPSFFDGSRAAKFLVPIRPKYHRKLFPEWQKSKNLQLTLFQDQLIAAGNCIKKAYLSHAPIKKIKAGDLLFFYRSSDLRGITSIGVVEQMHADVDSYEKAIRLTSKRSVFSEAELKKEIGHRSLIILFRWHFHLPKVVSYHYLRKHILKGPPQSILELSDEKYQIIKKAGELNESYSFH